MHCNAPPPSPPRRAGGLDVAVIRLPRLSNFTDLDPLVAEPGVAVRWVEHAGALGDPDLVVLAGTRATMADLGWLRESGLAAALDERRAVPRPSVILGLCGGFQMMGERIDDPAGVESPEPANAGLGWLRVRTVFEPEKVTRLARATSSDGDAVLGYEIRHGRVAATPGCIPWLTAEGSAGVAGARDELGAMFGTTLHGLFEQDAFRSAFLGAVALLRGRSWSPSGLVFAAAREHQIDLIADACEEYLDLEQVWRLVEEGTLRGPRYAPT